MDCLSCCLAGCPPCAAWATLNLLADFPEGLHGTAGAVCCDCLELPGARGGMDRSPGLGSRRRRCAGADDKTPTAGGLPPQVEKPSLFQNCLLPESITIITRSTRKRQTTGQREWSHLNKHQVGSEVQGNPRPCGPGASLSFAGPGEVDKLECRGQGRAQPQRALGFLGSRQSYLTHFPFSSFLLWHLPQTCDHMQRQLPGTSFPWGSLAPLKMPR